MNRKKNTPFVGMGYYTRANNEICLLGTRGKPLARKSKAVQQIVISQIREHSRKPDEVRERIVELFGDLPRIELFARQAADGWDCWGNEAPEN
jgi:N6-adenosine-specific RNA methylase IME4